MTIYNEIEPYAAQWIRNLVAAGHVAPGDVDDRSIVELQPGDVQHHVQAHFFAGIGCWSHALRLAGWPDDVPVWTGSCPCQPFSAAGRRRGTADARHLWPDWYRLIAQCRPPVVFGEQVASPDGLKWLDAVRADLEGAGYAFGAADLCAAGVGAPHIRQRLYWVAVADGERCEGLRVQLRERAPRCGQGSANGGRIEVGAGSSRPEGRGPSDDRESRRLGDPMLAGSQERSGPAIGPGPVRDEGQAAAEASTSGFWRAVEWLPCQDGRFRPVEPGTFPPAHGIANRVGRLRAIGNAIVPQVAEQFIRAAADWIAAG